MDILRLLSPHLRPHRRHLAVIALLQAVQTVAVLYLPTLSAAIIDNGLLADDTGYILVRGGYMLAIAVVQVAALLAALSLSTRIAAAVAGELRAGTFRHVLNLSTREVGVVGTSSLTTRTTNDVQQVQSFFFSLLTMLVPAPLIGIGAILFALSQDVSLTLLLIALLPVLIGIMALITARSQPLMALLQTAVDRINRIVGEQISGVRVIRAFRREDYEQQRFAAANDDLAAVGVRVGRWMTLLFPLAATVVNLFSVLVIWIGAYRVRDGDMPVGALTAFLGYLALVLVAVVSATFMLMMLPRAEVSAARIREVLATRSSVPPSRDGIDVPAGPAGLELRDVRFGYPGAPEDVLHDVSLSVRPGETVVLVGSTGSGKTTLLRLAIRLMDATAGAVLVGGADVRKLDRSALARTVALVPQQPRLFTGTIASNLLLGRPDASEETLWRALEVAQASEFVADLDGGLQAPVTAGGRNLSGGQRQRLTVARALVARPDIYLFDDIDAALDPDTGRRLWASLADELPDAAIVMVSQRLSSIDPAHRIVVLDAGRVVGAGRHSELLAGNVTYREIAASQPTEANA